MIRITCTGAEMVRLDELQDFQGDLKSLTQKKVDKLLAAMKKDGFSYPFFYWQDKGGTKFVFDGHQRQRVLEYAKSKGVQVPDEFPACKVEAKDRHDAARKLLAFNERYGTIEDEGLYRYMDEFGVTMDELGDMELPDIDLSKFEQSYFGGVEGNPYTDKIEAPIYEPTGDCPEIVELVDTGKAETLVGEIEKADIPEEVKAFLRQAAQRHAVFNYAKIAEYYAHAPADIQRLMENSALVIIDFDRAIELGFVNLEADIEQQYLDEYGNDG